MADRNKNLDNQNFQKDFNVDKDKNLGMGQQNLGQQGLNKDINKDVNRDINKDKDLNKNIPQGQQFSGQGQNKNY